MIIQTILSRKACRPMLTGGLICWGELILLRQTGKQSPGVTRIRLLLLSRISVFQFIPLTVFLTKLQFGQLLSVKVHQTGLEVLLGNWL